MPKPFNVEAERNHFALSPLTRQQIAALMLDLDCDARTVVIEAIAQLWQRECGEPGRDVFAELDELREQIAAIRAADAA